MLTILYTLMGVMSVGSGVRCKLQQLRNTGRGWVL